MTDKRRPGSEPNPQREIISEEELLPTSFEFEGKTVSVNELLESLYGKNLENDSARKIRKAYIDSIRAKTKEAGKPIELKDAVNLYAKFWLSPQIQRQAIRGSEAFRALVEHLFVANAKSEKLYELLMKEESPLGFISEINDKLGVTSIGTEGTRTIHKLRPRERQQVEGHKGELDSRNYSGFTEDIRQFIEEYFPNKVANSARNWEVRAVDHIDFNKIFEMMDISPELRRQIEERNEQEDFLRTLGNNFKHLS